MWVLFYAILHLLDNHHRRGWSVWGLIDIDVARVFLAALFLERPFVEHSELELSVPSYSLRQCGCVSMPECICKTIAIDVGSQFGDWLTSMLLVFF